MDFVRGVPLDRCLQSWGVHFKEAPRDSEDNYSASRRADHIDAFLSHDWQTPRWPKILALLLIFNSRAAAVASLSVTALTCGLLLADLLPGGWIIASSAAYSSFMLVFCFWQRLRRILCLTEKLVFLDRLCINQHDQKLKREGINSLAGILARSNKLIMLWSPRYFTRLWCTFEYSCFLREKFQARPVEFMPISLALLLLSAAVFISFLEILLQAFIAVEERVEMGEELTMQERALVFLPFLLPVLCILPAQIHYGAQHMEELRRLPQQMTNFSVRAAKCTCCSEDHCNAATGEILPCDKEILFQTLRRWHLQAQPEMPGHCPKGPEDHLDSFDALVREAFRPSMRNTLGSGVPPLHYIVVMLAPSQLAQLPQIVHLGMRAWRGWAFWRWMLDYCKFPAIALFTFWTTIFAWRVGSNFPKRLPRWTMVVTVELGALLLVLLFYMPYPLVRNRVEPSSLASLVPLACMWLVLACLYSRLYSWRDCRIFRGARHGP